MPRAISLLYLHGFLSSPQSKKAQLTSDYCKRTNCVDQMLLPSLQWGPDAAMAQLHGIVREAADQDIILIGSSLGGYYATYLAEYYGLPAALINPAVAPFDSWEAYLGEHRNYYSDAVIEVTRSHIAELENLHVDRLEKPENIMLLVETDDETLDYRKAVSKYAESPQLVRIGGSHAYANYSDDMPVMFYFLISRIP